jgi:hypothetical protein
LFTVEKDDTLSDQLIADLFQRKVNQSMLTGTVADKKVAEFVVAFISVDVMHMLSWFCACEEAMNCNILVVLAQVYVTILDGCSKWTIRLAVLLSP